MFLGPCRITDNGLATVAATINPLAGLPEKEILTGSSFLILFSILTVKKVGFILTIDIPLGKMTWSFFIGIELIPTVIPDKSTRYRIFRLERTVSYTHLTLPTIYSV